MTLETVCGTCFCEMTQADYPAQAEIMWVARRWLPLNTRFRMRYGRLGSTACWSDFAGRFGLWSAVLKTSGEMDAVRI